MKSDCIFCKIVAGTIPSYKIYEDDNYLAFLDISQFTDGHTLVVPKKHYRYVWDVKEIEEYMLVVNKIANHYRSLGYEYVDSLTFGRLVPHAHVHLVPHNGEDEEWNNALKGLEEFSNSKEPRLTEQKAKELLSKLQLN